MVRTIKSRNNANIWIEKRWRIAASLSKGSKRAGNNHLQIKRRLILLYVRYYPGVFFCEEFFWGVPCCITRRRKKSTECGFKNVRLREFLEQPFPRKKKFISEWPWFLNYWINSIVGTTAQYRAVHINWKMESLHGEFVPLNWWASQNV